MEWQRLESEKCPGCGHPRGESFDPAFERDWVASTRRCHACATRDRHLEAIDTDERQGLYAFVRRSPHEH